MEGFGSSQLLWLPENRRKWSILPQGCSPGKQGFLEFFISILSKLGNDLSHTFFLPLPFFFGLCQQQSNKVHRLSEGKPVNFLPGRCHSRKKKMFLLCLLQNVLFESHSLFCTRISYMNKIVSFKRHFAFHSDYQWLVDICGLICARASRLFWVILSIFSFPLFICLLVL